LERSTLRKKRFAAAFAPLLHQHVEFDTMFVDGSPQQIRLAAQRHEHLVQMPGAARLPTRRFGETGESGAKLVAPATDRFVRDHDTTLEQQLLDVAQAQAESEIPANRAADDGGREAVTVIKRFRFLFIASFYRRLSINLTEPSVHRITFAKDPDVALPIRRRPDAS
jgi:hypothetical protein